MFRERLKTAMDFRGMNGRDLANAACVTDRTISNYIRGKRGAYFDLLADVCKALNVSADYLLGLSDDMEVKKQK